MQYFSIFLLVFLSPARAISFSLVHTTTLGQSVYPDISRHISNYYINISAIPLYYTVSEHCHLVRGLI